MRTVSAGLREGSRPDRGGDVTDEKDGDLMIGPPGRQDGFGEITGRWYFRSPVGSRDDARRSG